MLNFTSLRLTLRQVFVTIAKLNIEKNIIFKIIFDIVTSMNNEKRIKKFY